MWMVSPVALTPWLLLAFIGTTVAKHRPHRRGGPLHDHRVPTKAPVVPAPTPTKRPSKWCSPYKKCPTPPSSDAPTTSPSSSPTAPPLYPCDAEVLSTGDSTTFYYVELGQTTGNFDLYYDMAEVPDGLTVTYEGTVVYTTGGPVSGNSFIYENIFGNSTSLSTKVLVEVSAPTPGTEWKVIIYCPNPP